MQLISSNYRSTPPSSAVQVNHGNPIARGLQRAWFASTGIDHVSGIPAVNSAATHNVPGQNQFGATLVRRAQDGVRVRLLVDGIGIYLGGRIDIRRLRAAGVQVALFVSPFRSSSPSRQMMPPASSSTP